LLYKYRFLCRGVEFLVHSNPPQGRQPIRVRYLAEALIGNNFYAVHEQFVLPFIKRLGLVVHADKPSRIDMQILIDVPASEFCALFESGHVVTKLRKFSIDGTVSKAVHKETLTLGTTAKVQVCIYDKGIELVQSVARCSIRHSEYRVRSNRAPPRQYVLSVPRNVYCNRINRYLGLSLPDLPVATSAMACVN